MNKSAFYTRVRSTVYGGALTSPQVEGLELLLAEANRRSVKQRIPSLHPGHCGLGDPFDSAKVLKLLTDSIVAATMAIDFVADGENKTAEARIKSAYYGLDNALTLVRRAIAA